MLNGVKMVVMALKFGPLALLLVRADVLRASSPHVPFMCILWNLPRFYAYRLLSRSKSVHAILNYAAFYRGFLPRKGKSLIIYYYFKRQRIKYCQYEQWLRATCQSIR